MGDHRHIISRPGWLLSLAFFLLSAAAPRAQEASPPCPMPVPPPVSPQITELARGWDQLHDEMLLRADQRRQERRLPIGAVVDPSCFTGVNRADGERIVSAIGAGLERAIAQAQHCHETLRLVELPDVITILRRTRIHCTPGDPNDNIVATMQRFYRHPGRERFTVGATRNYNMEVITPPLAAGPSGGKRTPSMLDQSPDELGSFFAHEAMHPLAMNNRDWHDDPGNRGSRGCNNSLFTDRIYFTQAACFPDSFYGHEFYADGGAYQCTDLCLSALTSGPEPREASRTEPATVIGDTVHAYGPPEGARPYPAAEARRICDRIRETRGR